MRQNNGKGRFADSCVACGINMLATAYWQTVKKGSSENCMNQALGDFCAASGINHVNSLQVIAPAPTSRSILEIMPCSWPDDTLEELEITRSVVLHIAALLAVSIC